MSLTINLFFFSIIGLIILGVGLGGFLDATYSGAKVVIESDFVQDKVEQSKDYVVEQLRNELANQISGDDSI